MSYVLGTKQAIMHSPYFLFPFFFFFLVIWGRFLNGLPLEMSWFDLQFYEALTLVL